MNDRESVFLSMDMGDEKFHRSYLTGTTKEEGFFAQLWKAKKIPAPENRYRDEKPKKCALRVFYFKSSTSSSFSTSSVDSTVWGATPAIRFMKKMALSVKMYIEGTTTSVRKVAKVRPKITVQLIGPQNMAESPPV